MNIAGIASIRLRLRALFLRARVERELHAEIAFHLAEETAIRRASGMTTPEAHAAALRKFGSIAAVEDAARDERRTGFVDRSLQDLRYGGRILFRSPLLALVAIGTLALGIGANTAVFGLLDAVLLRRLAVPHPEQLHRFVRVRPNGISESVAYPLFRQLATGAPALGVVAGFAFREVAVPGRSRPVIVQLTSDRWFRAVGVAPRLGRSWIAATAGTDRGVVISARYAAALPGVGLGSFVHLGTRSYPVIGIMPAGFNGISLDYTADVWMPIELQPELDGTSTLADPDLNWVRVITRLPPGNDPAQAAAVADLAFIRTARVTAGADTAEHLVLQRADRADLHDRAGLAGPLMLVMALVGLVLLIACANIANLQLARNVTRKRELTIRLAMGASRGRLVRQLLTESLLLALAGGAAGVAVAGGLSRMLVGFVVSHAAGGGAPPGLGDVLQVRVLVFTGGLSVAIAMVFGLLPALRGTRIDLVPALKLTPSMAAGASKRQHQVLLVMQLAVSLALLVAGGMVMRSLMGAQSLDSGFDRRGLVQLALDWRQVPDSNRRSVAERVAEAVRQIPGVRDAAVAVPAILGSEHVTISTLAFGTPSDADGRGQSIEVAAASTEYFATIGLPPLRGRAFGDADREGSPAVVILNRGAAHQLFGGDDVVGRQFDFTGRGHRVTVVGLVADTRVNRVVAPPPPMVYVPLEQDGGNIAAGARVVDVRVGTGIVATRQLVAAANSINPNLHADVHAVDELIGDDLALERAGAWATGAFGLVGLLLAAIGVYGMHAFAVTRRTAETGIRLALGATPHAVLWMLWREAMRPVIAGAAIGLVFAAGASRLLRNTVPGLGALDPAVIGAATVLLMLIAGVASLLPAVRASRLAPTAALRVE